MKKESLDQPLKAMALRRSLALSGDLYAIEDVPQNPSELEALGRIVDAELECYVERNLSTSDYKRYTNGIGSLDPDLGRRFMDLVDQFIIDQALTLGVRLLFSPRIISRLLQWQETEKNGPRFLSRLGRNLELCAKVRRGRAKQPITDERIYEFRKDLIAELRALRNKLQVDFKGRSRVLQVAKATPLIEDELSKGNNPFERLCENRTAFLRYLQHEQLKSQLWLSGELQPAAFANHFIGWSTGGRQPEKVRQLISRLGSLKKSPQFPSKKL